MGRATRCVRTFVVPKPQRNKFRLITDFRPLNEACETLPVSYDDLRSLRHAFGRKVGCLFSVDLKDGYHHVGLHRSAWHLFQFHIQGEVFEATTLPFGWS